MARFISRGRVNVPGRARGGRQRMAWKKSPDWLVESFTAVVPPGIEKRQMFGYPAAFVQGNMAFGLFEDHLVMRVGEPDLLDLRNRGATAFEPMAGRPMKGWVT